MASHPYVKRIIADIKELATNEQYKKDGIFYKQDDENIRKGTALIFGPSETPYEDCPMFFDIEITDSYPLEPPKVAFRTSDSITRFHPNLYINGKVCLSILHTWEGPKWASTMRLSTILVTIQSLLDSDPLRHEPGMPSTSPFKEYATLIESRCIRYILNVASSLINISTPPKIKYVEEYEDILKERLEATLTRTIEILTKLVESGEKSWLTITYQLSGTTEYVEMLGLAKTLYQKLKG